MQFRMDTEELIRDYLLLKNSRIVPELYVVGYLDQNCFITLPENPASIKLTNIDPISYCFIRKGKTITTKEVKTVLDEDIKCTVAKDQYRWVVNDKNLTPQLERVIKCFFNDIGYEFTAIAGDVELSYESNRTHKLIDNHAPIPVIVASEGITYRKIKYRSD